MCIHTSAGNSFLTNLTSVTFSRRDQGVAKYTPIPNDLLKDYDISALAAHSRFCGRVLFISQSTTFSSF